MRRRAAGLAARFRKAISAEDEARRRADEAQQRREEQARAARATLLDDLAAFAHETGFLQQRRTPESLALRYGDRVLTFEAQGTADVVRITFDGEEHEENALYRETDLDDRWVWVRRRKRREQRLPFFDQGLEKLLVLALGLPEPSDEPVPGDDRDRTL